MIKKIAELQKLSKLRRFAIIFSFTLFCASIILVIAPISTGYFGIGIFPPLYFFILFLVTYYFEKLHKILAIIFYAGMGLFAVVFVIFCVSIMAYGSGDLPENPDLVVVLGCHVKNGKPGVLLRTRLDKSIEILDKYPESFCVVSGGQGADESLPEAVEMKKYLEEWGFSGSRIVEESESHSTFENLLNTKNLLDDLSFDFGNASIVILTSEYHVPRSVMIAKRIFGENTRVFAVKSKSPWAMFSSGITREFFAYVKSWFFDRV